MRIGTSLRTIGVAVAALTLLAACDVHGTVNVGQRDAGKVVTVAAGQTLAVNLDVVTYVPLDITVISSGGAPPPLDRTVAFWDKQGNHALFVAKAISPTFPQEQVRVVARPRTQPSEIVWSINVIVTR